MGAPLARYAPSRSYYWTGAAALGLAAFSFWLALRWAPAAIPSGLFVASAFLLFFIGSRPAIEVYQDFLTIGERRIPWESVRKVDRTGWVSPLVLSLTLAHGERKLVVFPGDLDSTNSLLRHIRRFSREALIDGIPYRRFWGEEAALAERRSLSSPKYQLLRREDEEEVERLYQRLKTVGHIDPKKSPDEK